MNLVKNTYGVSTVILPKLANLNMINKLGGSSLDRKKTTSKHKLVDPIKKDIDKPLVEEKKIKLRSMSNRTKSKIVNKLRSFARINSYLTFLTLTFVNEVDDQLAVKILRAFLDNAKKRLKGFEYLWVAERQTKNLTFKNNIHFHLVTNKFFLLEKWWPYWIDVQSKFGIKPREEHFRPGSAFNIKKADTTDVRKLGIYLTKYITKNEGKFNCQVWNCSKKISRLYTCHYTGISFINQLERLSDQNMLGGELKKYRTDYCDVCIYPYNKITSRFFTKLDVKNKEVWKDEELKEKGGMK